MVPDTRSIARATAYLQSSVHTPKPSLGSPESSRARGAPCARSALVVEHRDEVFAGLRTVLEEAGLQVERAELGGVVAGKIRKAVPDLILVNEQMPDESGWLITCKLRLSRHAQLVWLYAVQRPHMVADWKEVIGVDEVIDYGGVFTKLFQDVRGRLRNGRDSLCEPLVRQSIVVAPPLVA